MLHVNCDMKIRWETDILQLRYNGDSRSHWTSSCPNDPTNDEEGRKASAATFYKNLSAPFEPLTVDEEREDVTLLRAIVRKRTNIDGLFHRRLWVRCAAIRSFYEAIEMGPWSKTGEGATKVLSLSRRMEVVASVQLCLCQIKRQCR
jgi:hypothetical protein